MSTNSHNELEERQQMIEQMGFLGQMLSTETVHFHQTAAAKLEMSITDSKTISALMQEGPMTAGQLARRLSLTTGAVTSVIDRLEERGVVHRVADPTDRRKVFIHTDPEKLKECGTIYDSVAQTFAELLSNYSVEQLHFLVEYYKASIELTKLEIAKLNS